MKPGPSYVGSQIILTTKHQKSLAIAPPFKNTLGAIVIENVVDTDMLGTFSKEIPRQGTALECARQKCQWSFAKSDMNVEFALASEGSFGPHPYLPFIPCDHEILYFIDRKHDFHLHINAISEKTNFRYETVNSFAALEKFADETLFPSHALIIRPNKPNKDFFIEKGLQNKDDLERAFFVSRQNSLDGMVSVETDMRAHVNPSRMKFIEKLAYQFVTRLATTCPKCNFPGWGKVRSEKGLLCRICKSKTEFIRNLYYGCVKCPYEECHERSDGLKYAEPQYCQFCNP